MIHNHGPEEGAGLACNESRLPDGSLQGACLVSSTYYLFCLSHNPATVVQELDIRVEFPSGEELHTSHPNCDFAISRVSGAPIELGCPGFGSTPCGGHEGIKWVEIDWLRVLWVALDARALEVQRLTRRSGELACWNFERLNALRYELGID